MKLEYVWSIFPILLISATVLVLQLTKKEPIERLNEAIRSISMDLILIEIEGEIHPGIISTDNLTFPDALVFCEESNKRMPSDYFKLNINPIQIVNNQTIEDSFFWINASMDLTKTGTVGIPKMQEELGQIRRKIFDQPLWVVQDYFWRGKTRNGLSFDIPGETEEKREFHLICDDDRIDNKTGIVKFQTR